VEDQRQKPNQPTIGGLSFQPVRKFGPFTDNEPSALVAHGLAIWLATTVLGGAALTAAIQTVGRRFESPEFTELEYLGFLMAGILGLLLAIAFFIKALYRPL
jgi:hypothetical protein